MYKLSIIIYIICISCAPPNKKKSEESNVPESKLSSLDGVWTRSIETRGGKVKESLLFKSNSFTKTSILFDAQNIEIVKLITLGNINYDTQRLSGTRTGEISFVDITMSVMKATWIQSQNTVDNLVQNKKSHIPDDCLQAGHVEKVEYDLILSSSCFGFDFWNTKVPNEMRIIGVSPEIDFIHKNSTKSFNTYFKREST